MKDYHEMLDELYQRLEKFVPKADVRWEPPEFKVIPEKKRVRIVNFRQVCDSLKRNVEFCRKWFSKQCATPANLDGQVLILNTRLSPNFLADKLKLFIKKFVICKECGRPDTELVHEKGTIILYCHACGARYTVV